MTHVTFYPKQHRIRVEGHAGAARKGEDLVCAAASILGWTLIAAADEFNLHLHLDELEGIMDIQCKPDRGEEPLCRYLYEVIAGGFELLADRNPDYVLMEEKDDGDE